ncbi:GAF domain-containing protein [Nocardioides rubriscoriae]|uniref:GAF domain-containing protein n=1 Tax=Nocardioides rubriscoriae TaxID=642762 RepID=UPI0011DF2024|nr:GAF domain-containing protein [Nocardioides rubriscoriae]
MTTYAAIEPGTDLSVRARELTRVHDAFLGGSRGGQPRDVVARSWRRVLALGVHPEGGNARDPFDLEELERRRRESPLRLVADELRRVLTSVADASLFLMVVCDADGVILWREGAARVRLEADRLGFTEGATWTEERVGTNAIGTALAEAAPVQLFSAEHFEQQQHPWYCTAHPIHDPRTGDLLGVVDVSGPALTLHPALVVLVESAVRLAEAALWRHHQEGLDRLRREAAPLVGVGPLLVVDDHGWVAHQSGVAARDRIEAPRADRAVAVPGLGLCLPERLGHGWLVRPVSGPVGLTARLGADGVLEVLSGDEPWRTTLTRRHAQILGILATAGPAGLGAAALSTALYGDAEHVVTARAEVSRLRRVVGALVATNPYRLADGVSLETCSDV